MITPEYKQQLVKLHATQKWGNAGKVWVPDVMRLLARYNLDHYAAPTVLDYGAGTRSFSRVMSKENPWVKVTDYDPGIPGIDEPPEGRYHIVLCTDVLEHVEPTYVGETLVRLRELTGIAAVLNIACKPARQFLPDGRNAHLSVHPAAWWQEKIEHLWRRIEILNTHKNFSLVAIA